MMTEPEKIFFDMDGVLADFSRVINELCEMETPPQGEGQAPGRDDLMWERIRMQDHFYDRLHIMPGAREMFNKICSRYGNRCEILSAIPRPDKGHDSLLSEIVKFLSISWRVK